MGRMISSDDRRARGKARATSLFDLAEMPFRRFLYGLSPFLLVQYNSLKLRGRPFRPRKARTFEDKLLWLMLYWRAPLKTTCADKYAVRAYVTGQGRGHLLPGLFGVYSSSSEIDFSRLPKRFVLKCTHGSGFNLFCRDKDRFDIPGAVKKLDHWMKADLSRINGEVHYASIKPRIICETLLEGQPDSPIDDYKVYCFDGRPHCVMACTERDTGRAKFDFYDPEWTEKLAYCRSSLSAGRNIPRPGALEEIIEAAGVLSKPFPFVRVDFYSIHDRAVFGEMTFTPNGCIDLDLTDLAQDTMGDLIRLPPKVLGRALRPPATT